MNKHQLEYFSEPPPSIAVAPIEPARKRPSNCGVLSLACFGIWSACVAIGIFGAHFDPRSRVEHGAMHYLLLILFASIILIPTGLILGVVGVFLPDRHPRCAAVGLVLHGTLILCRLWMH